MTHMQKVVCIKSADPRQEQFGARGFMYYIDLNSLYGDSNGDWYADLYSLGFTKLGTIKINRFRSMTHTQTKENTR